MPLDSTVTLLENRRLGPAAFIASFRSEPLASQTQPGQFVMLGFPASTEPLLRRPYSIYRVGRPGGAPDTCEIQYKVVGQGTARLASLGAGESVSCLGPLGSPFLPPPPGATPLLVAGGIGIAGLLHQAVHLVALGARPRLLFGCRSAEDLPLVEGFEALGIPTEVATEDGSAGRRGLVTALLEAHLPPATPEAPAGGAGAGERANPRGLAVEVYACGPAPMLSAVARQTAGRAGCQVSVESPMACGFGVCLGCVVETAHGEGFGRFVRACVEGPVFRAEALKW
jgi:dihydroorotate dehydrogenase electron transfer subunit